ncbi:unnamed protein product [Urochloa decumbens]|uniref:Uncharacterized protein n=1 Tax=Urochloa decumbens TaxID=240449 RepID=A0ABC8Y111_9POAL
MMRSSALAAAVIVLAVLASGGVVGTAARPVATQGGVSVVAAMDHRVVAVEFVTGTNSSAQPSNCTYGNNVGGVCPPAPPSSGGH